MVEKSQVTEKNVEFVHSEIVSELQTRKRALLAERDTLYRAAARIAEIDSTIAALDVEINRSKSMLPTPEQAATESKNA